MHRMMGFFAHLTTGGEANPERAAGVAPYYDLAFSDDSPLGALLGELDPAALVHPTADARLWDEAPAASGPWIETPQGAPPANRMDPEDAARRFHALKRRWYFEAEEGGRLLDQLPEDRRTFSDVLNADPPRATHLNRLVGALAQFFGEAPAGPGHPPTLPLWTGLRYEATGEPTALVAAGEGLKPDDLELLRPRLHPAAEPLLEYAPDHVRLAQKGTDGTVGLDVDLRVWRALARIARGAPTAYRDEDVARRLHRFLSAVAAGQGAPEDLDRLRIRDIEAGAEYGVAIESGKYLL